MLYGRLDLPETYAAFLTHPVWMSALQWLRNLSPEIAPGIYQLLGDDMFANVHGYATKPRAACRYESHRRYIDLQYCIRGAELIEWHPTSHLRASDDYNPTKDVIHYAAPAEPDAKMTLSPGSFAIFFPADGHMPKVATALHPRVEKLVIKIDRKLLE